MAPSGNLRKWFGHDPKKWEEFVKKYKKELKDKKVDLEKIKKEAKNKEVTLLYAAKDENHNNAVVIKKVIDSREEK